MVRLFERGEEAIRLETRFDQKANDYVLFVLKRDGAHETERFKDAFTLRARLEALERSLEASQWTRTGPFVLPEGWKQTRRVRGADTFGASSMCLTVDDLKVSGLHVVRGCV